MLHYGGHDVHLFTPTPLNLSKPQGKGNPMTPNMVHDAVDALVAADVAVLDRDELAALVRRNRQLRSWLDSNDVRFARRGRELADQGRAEPPDSLLGDHGQRSSREAADVTQRTVACEAMPSFEAALAAGEISAGHVDAVVAVLGRLDAVVRADFIGHEAGLLQSARSQSVVTFQRTCRDVARHLTAMHDSRSEIDELDRQRAQSRIRRWRDKSDGMCHTHIELDPERDAALQSALDAHLRRLRKHAGTSGLPWDQLLVDAYMSAVTSGVTRAPAPAAGSGGTAGVAVAIGAPPAQLRVPQVGVLVDVNTLLHGLHDNGLCETADGVPLPASTVRRMCCDAEILPIVLDGEGRALDVGRSSRTVTAAQRQALRAMHRTCIGPDCTVPFDRCRIHHVDWFERDLGPTDLANLVPLCERDHQRVHEGAWVLTLTPDRVATWIRPDGAVHSSGSCIDRAPRGVARPVLERG